MIRILIVAALIAASLFVVKENGYLSRAGVRYCTSTSTAPRADGSWACP